MRLTGHLFASWVSGLCARVVLQTPLVGSSGNVEAPLMVSQTASSQAPLRWRVLGLPSRRKLITSTAPGISQQHLQKKARSLTVGPLLENTQSPRTQAQGDDVLPHTALASSDASHSLPTPLVWTALAPASAAHWTQMLREAAPFSAQGSSSSDRPVGRAFTWGLVSDPPWQGSGCQAG